MKISSSRRFVSSASRVVVVGCGQMGTGIALTAARKGNFHVSILDREEVSLIRSRHFCEKWLAGEAEKGRIDSEGADECLRRIEFVHLQDRRKCNTHLSHEDVFFAIEAVSENLEMKRDVFRQLDKETPGNAILASNTSSISITKLAAVTERPEMVIGMHFMNPVPKMPLIEVVKGLATSEETLRATLDFGAKLGKEAGMSLDRPGFIANRILMPYINEAVMAFQEGVSAIEDIDKIMKMGTNVPMGPLQLADFIGLDTCLSIMRVLHENMGDSKYRPAPLLVQYVDAGWVGKKAGRGFYKY